MRPKFSIVWHNYPHIKRWTRQKLYTEMGWDEFINNPNFFNTCAIRTSYALQKSGFEITSSVGMRSLKGSTANKEIEIDQEKLSEQLKVKWGVPEVYNSRATAEDGISSRNGVVSYWRIPGYLIGNRLGGHIDVIDGKGPEIRTRTVRHWMFWSRVESYVVDEPSLCGTHCYQDVPEVWFWELP